MEAVHLIHHFPAPGRVEQDQIRKVVDLLYSSTKAASNSGVDPKGRRAGISFSHMCCTFVPVDKEGNFLYRIILWNDFEVLRCFHICGNTYHRFRDYNYTGYPFWAANSTLT